MSDVQRKVLISGLVQGVGFRYSTLQEVSRYCAAGNKLKGYVRNLEDGRLEAVFCGNETSVMTMIDWCRNGPAGANVNSVEVIEESVDLLLQAFVIRH